MQLISVYMVPQGVRTMIKKFYHRYLSSHMNSPRPAIWHFTSIEIVIPQSTSKMNKLTISYFYANRIFSKTRPSVSAKI